MTPFLFLFSAIAFALLSVMFLIHYRKMGILEIKLDENIRALSKSKIRENVLQTSLDRNIAKLEKISACIVTPQTDNEKLTCVSKLLED